jgi:hypothetical protein
MEFHARSEKPVRAVELPPKEGLCIDGEVPIMSRRAKSANSAIVKQRVSSWIAELQAAKTTSHGLPEDVLIHALDGYGSENLSWPQIRSHAVKFYTYISAQASDCTISRAFQRPIGTKKVPTAAVSIFRLMAAPLRGSETLFNASIFTFVFRPSGVWFLTTTDPLYTTDHLHQRMLERADKHYRSLSQAQDDLSILWPTLIELGQPRRPRQGRRAGVTDFVTPWSDGLMFGNMEKLDGPVELFAPTVVDFSNGAGIKRNLTDFHCAGDERLAVIVRTYVAEDQLKEAQRRLKTALERFVERHRDVLYSLMARSRITYVEEPYGPALAELFVSPHLSTADFPKAIEELDEITSSQDWLDEVNRSRENRSRRRVQAG